MSLGDVQIQDHVAVILRDISARTTIRYNGAMDLDLTSQINHELDGLGADAQKRVLDYVRSLKKTPTGTPGTALTRFAGTIDVVEAKLMMDAIDAGCGQVNLDEW